MQFLMFVYMTIKQRSYRGGDEQILFELYVCESVSLKTFENICDYWIYAKDSNDKTKSMCENSNSTMNKKFTNEFYLPIQQSIHSLNHKTKISQTKTMNNKSH